MFLPLSSLKIIEFESEPISSFCGTILSDFGADVIIITQTKEPQTTIPIEEDFLNRGKRSIVLDLSIQSNFNIFKKIVKQIDIFINSSIPNTLEKIGLSPNELLLINPKLIICRISGYGQTGKMSQQDGKDINFLATSGILSTFGPKEQLPGFPANIMSFGGGSVMGAIGILMAVLEREKTGRGQVIDNSITDSLLYLNSFVLNLKRFNYWNKERGENLLDSGAPFYKNYECKDGGFLSVGAIETKFYIDFIKGLNFDEATQEKCLDNQLNQEMWEELHQIFKKRILEKTLEEWKIIYDKLDACVTPILNLEDLKNNNYLNERNSIIIDSSNSSIPEKLQFQIAPSPKLSKHNLTKRDILRKNAKLGGNTYEILKEFIADSVEIKEYYKDSQKNSSKL